MNSGYVDVSVLPGFLTATVLICLAPGPDMAYMVGTGVAGGRRAATRAGLGVASGVSIYAIAVAAGLGALMVNHPGVLTGLQVFGAAYLAWLAYGCYRGARHARPGGPADTGQRHWFRRGLIVNLTNPKVMVFFLAFLPQFLGRTTHPVVQLLMLGLVFQLVGLVVDLAIGWTAGSVRDRILARPVVQRAMSLASACVFLLLAAVVGVAAVDSLVALG